MLINQLEERLNANKKVVVKIYSLEYTIEIDNSKYVIYSNLYSNRKYTYDSLKELLSNYQIYNESIMSNLSRVSIIERGNVNEWDSSKNATRNY